MSKLPSCRNLGQKALPWTRTGHICDRRGLAQERADVDSEVLEFRRLEIILYFVFYNREMQFHDLRSLFTFLSESKGDCSESNLHSLAC